MNDNEHYRQGALELTPPDDLSILHPDAPDAPQPAEAMTAREAAKALIRPYVLRGDSVDDLKQSLMGSANDAFRAQIGGSVAVDGASRKVRSNQIGVSRVGTERVGEVFSLASLYKEIQAEADAGEVAGARPVDAPAMTAAEAAAALPAVESPVTRIDADPAVLPNRRLPNDFWPEYHAEWGFREEHGLPAVSPAEFRDLRDQADGVIEPRGGRWHVELERPAYPEWEPLSDETEEAAEWDEEAAIEAATLPDAPRDDRFIPEGKTVFDARRERLDATIDVLAAKVESIVTGEGYRDYLRMLSRFHAYSANNVALILAQYPDATRIMGYGNKQGTTGWKSLGRNVRQGEKGIRIIRPVHTTIEDEQSGEPTRVLRGFATATVFDIRQTEGVPLPHEPRPQDLTQDEVVRSLELKVKLLRFIDERGVRVVRDHDGTQKGYWNPERREIGIRADLSGVRELKTLTHEAAHLVADHRRDAVAMADAETVAESVAFVVLDHHDIDTSAYSVPYIAGWARDPAVVQRNLDAVRAISHALLTAMGDVQGDASGDGEGGAAR